MTTTTPAAGGRVEHERVKLGGRWVRAGELCRVTGQRGRYRFVRHVVTPERAWVDVYGPVDAKRAPITRSLPLDVVRRAPQREQVGR